MRISSDGEFERLKEMDVLDENLQETRNKGLKYFNKIGYIKENKKEVPRWVIDEEYLLKVVFF